MSFVWEPPHAFSNPEIILESGQTVTDPLYRPEEAAKYVRMAASTLAKRRSNGLKPRFLKLGPRLTAYRKSDLDDFLDSCVRN